MARIAHVTATFPPYWAGTGNVAYHDARVLTELGYDVTVFTATTEGEGVATPFAVRRLPPLLRIGNAALTPALVSRLKGYDLVHLHVPYLMGGELVAVAARANRLPLVVTYHNDLVAQGVKGMLFRGYKHLNQRFVLASADVLVVTSADYGEHSDLAWAAPRATPRAVVPNGVDVRAFTPLSAPPLWRGERGVPDGAPVVLFVGGLDRAHYFKGLDVLLEALVQVPGVRLAVVGEGEMRPEYEARARAVAPGRVEFLGKVPLERLVELYGDASVTVLPSVSAGEAFGMVLIESMACATPVIASDLPGVRTVVLEGETGYLTPPGDPRALAERLRALSCDPLRARAMGEAGRRRVVQRYDWDVVVRELDSVYQSLLAA